MRVAYVRSSTLLQNNQYQLDALEKYDIEKYFIDKCSGKNTDRPQFKEMMDYIREGDEIITYDFSRISRSLKDLLNIIDELDKKKVKLISIKENLDTSTSTGMLMVSMIGAVNQFQLANQREKQLEGIAIAKQNGKYKGRKKINYPSNWEEVYNKWKHREIKSKEAMELTGLKKATFYNLLNKYEEIIKKQSN